jgi:hypothetical protein
MQQAARFHKSSAQTNSPKHLRYLEDQAEITPSVKNKKVLAEAYLHSGMFEKAIPVFENCLQGLHEKDFFCNKGIVLRAFF